MARITPTTISTELSKQLDSYADVAQLVERSQCTKSRSLKLAAGFGAAASIGLMTFDQASADIIYSGPQNISLSLAGASSNFFTSVGIDVDLDSVDDFFFDARNFVSEGGPNAFDVDWAAGNNVIYSFIPGGGLGTTLGVKKLPANYLISSGRFPNYTTPGLPTRAYFAATFAGTIADPWSVIGNPDITVTGFMGFQINDDQFGWMRIRLETSSIDEGAFGGRLETLTIIDWAFQTIPGQPIRAGAIPEPAAATTLGLLAMGAVGLRRVRKKQVK